MNIVRTTTFGLLALLFTTCAAQEDTTAHRVTFGFSLGANYAMVDLRAPSSQAQGIHGWGFRMGTLTEWLLNPAWSIISRAELGFNPTRVDLRDAGEVTGSYKVYPALLDISVQAAHGWTTGIRRIYVMAGPMLRVPANSSMNEDFMSPISRADAAIDVGIGREKRLPKFRVAWELRYAHGLRDLLEPGQEGDLHFRTLMLSLCFKS